LEEQRRSETGFGQVLASWRVENIRAAMRFLDSVDESAPARPAARRWSGASSGTTGGA
jgi:hypothetical protein